MSQIYISVVVATQSEIIENRLLNFDILLDKWEAEVHRAELEEWIEKFPKPGQSKLLEPPTDEAGLLAHQLSRIIDGRDAELFGPYYLDPEGDSSWIEHRPYDWTRLEAINVS